MSQIITYDFTQNFIRELTDYLEEVYLKKGQDLSRLAIVFGGKRPALFLKKELARKVKGSFFSPRFLTIDEFIDYTLRKKTPFEKASDLEVSYLIYQLAQREAPRILKGRNSFAEFLPWAQEILSFIELLDLEDVPLESLRNVQLNAQIGYAIPKDINALLEHVVRLRQKCHNHLEQDHIYPRGLRYLRASQSISQLDFSEFDQVLFCNFFYLHRTECQIMQSLYHRKKATFFFQGDEETWPTLQRLSQEWSCSIKPQDATTFKNSSSPEPRLKLYAGFDAHAQVCWVREILKGIKKLDQTVIVLPEPKHVIPLLSEITALVDEFNLSMGYPLQRSSLYTLLDFIFKAQLNRRKDEYYTRDYLKVLRHPFIKNLKIEQDPSVARVLIHKLEEILMGQERAPLSGSLFVRLKDVEQLEELYQLSFEILQRMGVVVQLDQLKEVMKRLHVLLFESWEPIDNFYDLCTQLDGLLDVLMKKSFLSAYPLNLKIAERIWAIQDELKTVTFNRESFPSAELFKIVQKRIQKELVAFLGSPLKGLQILGLFETRSLNFENVIVMDVNEGVLPKLQVYKPLIPREVLVSLDLEKIEQEEEIQRYQFMRLISAAKNVHLIYEESQNKEKSRFVEELIWEKQKKSQKIEVMDTAKASFRVKIQPKQTEIPKTPDVIEFLRKLTYSVSSINTYVRCPLRFYYRYVLGLDEKEDLLEEPEAKEIGNFMHNLLEEAFQPLVGQKPVLNQRFQNRFQKLLDERFDEHFSRSMRSEAFLLKNVVAFRLKQFLSKEQQASPKDLRDVAEVLAIEEKFMDTIPLSSGEIRFVYKIDRVDRLADGTIVILDYKTGRTDLMPKSLEKIESMSLTRSAIRENIRSFQLPMYFYYLTKQYPDAAINAAFYNLRTMDIHPLITAKTSHSSKYINAFFLKTLDVIVREIFDSAQPFRPDDSDPRYCATCPFYPACR